jgi:hypothetical protein
MNCSGVLLHNGKTTNVQHADLAIVADTAQDRETLIRKTVQKMLKAGNFTAAKKLLATLSKNN